MLTVQTPTGSSIRVATMNDAAKAINLSRISEIDAQIAELQSKRASAVEALWELFGGNTGKHEVPGVGSVTFSANNTYDKDAIMAALKRGQFQRVSTRVLDMAKVKSQYPDVYEDAKRNRGYRASVSINK